VLRKIFNDKNYVQFLLLSSAAMIFVVPAGSHVYRYLGPATLFFFLLSKYFQGELAPVRLKKIRPDSSVVLFSLLFLLACVSFVPQTFGTMLIFATLYFGIRDKIEISRRLVWGILTFFSLVLILWVYRYVNHMPMYGRPVNNNFLGVKAILFFICCVKFSFWPGQLLTFAGVLPVRCRTLMLSLVVYCFTLIPVVRKRLSARIVAIYFLVVTTTIIGAGALFADKVINVNINPRVGRYLKWRKHMTLNRFSAGRLEINNVFFRNLSGDYRRILFGEGENYKGAKIRKKVNLVHNAFLEIFARQGLLFLLVYLCLLYRFIVRWGRGEDFPIIITMITYGTTFGSVFNTFPLLLQLGLLLVVPDSYPSSCPHRNCSGNAAETVFRV